MLTTVTTALTEAQVHEVVALAARQSAEVLSEHKLVGLAAATGARHLSVRDGNGTLLAYAQLAEQGGFTNLELAWSEIDAALVAARAALELVDRSIVQLWSRRPELPPAVLELAGQLGLHPARTVVQLRRSAEGFAPSDLPTRRFHPSQDGPAFLAANARAFAAHPEQGSWSAEDLAAHLSLGWVDLDLFRVVELDGALAGWCWGKRVGTEGEIYVIGVDPGFQGRGLGRRLLLAGVEALRKAGAETISLYVEADNTAARALYAAEGFEEVGRVTAWRV